jgi:hypothetical protein
MTHYLRFPDEATGMAALADYRTENGAWITASHSHALDVVGVITIGGEYDPETGDVLVSPTVLDGWHVNYMGKLPSEWIVYLVTPAEPVRVFAA